MLGDLRDKFASYLAQHNTCIISTSGTEGAWAMPVRCVVDGLHVICLIPRWADVAYFLEDKPQVLLIMLVPGPDLCWLQVNGRALPQEVLPPENQLQEMQDIAPLSLHQDQELFITVEVVPDRIDRLDESQGWGHRETLEM